MLKATRRLSFSRRTVAAALIAAWGSAGLAGWATADEPNSGSASNPKIELKKSVPSQANSTVITAGASASGQAGGFAVGSSNGNAGAQAFGQTQSSASVQIGTAQPSDSVSSSGNKPTSRSSSKKSSSSTSARATSGESVSRSTVKEGDQEITVVSAITPRQEITIRQSSDEGIEVQLKPRSRSAKADENANKKVKTFKAASLEEFKTRHAKIYPLVEKYLLTEPAEATAVAATGNEAQEMAAKQIEQMIKQNAGNPLIQDALRQSLESIRSAQ